MFGWFKSQKTSLPPAKEPPAPIEEFTDPRSVLDTFTRLTGIHFKHKEPIITTKLAHFCRNRHIFSFRELHLNLTSDSGLLQELVNYLTVNETYFFREVQQIDYMARKAAESKKAVRILCAPGSTGEEPYSIAIALLEHGVPPAKIDIVSFDINSDAVAQAIEASYSPRALHKTSPGIQKRYFLSEEDRINVRSEVKKLVTFRVLNVFDEALFTLGSFDYIFSRNMMIYFDPPTAQAAIGNLARLARSSESLFFFGHADILSLPPQMREHHAQGVKFYTLASPSL